MLRLGKGNGDQYLSSFYTLGSIDGILDNSFGNGGINTNPQHYTYNSLVIEPGNRKILIAGMKDFDEIVVGACSYQWIYR